MYNPNNDYVMLVYTNYDQEVPELIIFTGTIDDAVRIASEQNAFEVDVYEGTRIHPDARSVCTVMYGGNIFWED